MISTLLLILITIFIPPLGVFLVAGCGADFFINVLLTLLGYFPGHIHAFYIEYVYYKRREQMRSGVVDARPAPGVYSDRVQRGGTHGHGHGQNGRIPAGTTTGAPPPPAPMPQQQQQQPLPVGQQGYGTV